ncbi:restriction endonuclease fold toxin [Actinokineospora sp.]|uniref:restriction endonuclease fold toxin n=1 Tax=Actinokineospora sp. TaxID=1872133 RepID=UPI00403829B2
MRTPVSVHRSGAKVSLRRAALTVLAVVVVAVTLPVGSVAAAPPPAASPEVPTPQRESSVPVNAVSASPVSTQPVPGRALSNAPGFAWPGAEVAEVDLGRASGGGLAKVDRLPVLVGEPQSASPDRTTPGKVRVRIIDNAKPSNGSSALVFRVERADGVKEPGQVRVAVDYSGFRHAFGGDWSARLRLVSVPECALSTPDRLECLPTPRESHNDAMSGIVAADTAADGGMLALMAGSSGAGGDFAASALAPSSTWSAGGSSGEFTWSYPMRVPPTLGGPAPEVALAYSSGSVDGRTSSTNNQPSWVGEGFDLPVGGHVERRYKSCADDLGGNNGQTKTGDLCWGTENAFVTLGGKASELIRNDADGVWRLKNDDGSRIEKTTSSGNGDNNGESWRITTREGTQYLFGSRAAANSTWTVPVFGNNPGEDCYQSAYSTSWCQQAYRWNLDHVVDPNGNTTGYVYQTESNLYGRNLATAGSTYHRGGWLDRIEYGTHTATPGQAPMRVLLTAADRCVTPGATCTASNPSNWPDTPWDQNCTGGTCPGKTSPTFWTQKRLAAVTTQVWAGSAYRDVDSWTLEHRFLDPGDSTSAALWLEAIRHTGLVGGSATVPDVNFNEIPLSNRVDGIDTLPPLVRHRISSIMNETGGQIAVTYSPRECDRSSVMPATPDSNTKRCFPVYWTPQGQPQLLDWFHKYVVTAVTQHDHTGGGRPILTSYDYLGAPAWHYDDEDGLVPADRKTWSQWRGYGQVGVTVGDATVNRTRSVSTYLRGMDEDKLANGTRRDVVVTDSSGGTVDDHELLAGTVRETVTYKAFGDSTVLSATVTDPWISAARATSVRPWGTDTAHLTASVSVRSRVALETGGWRTTQIDTSVDPATGLPTAVSDLGDTSTTADDRCTRTTYATNTGAWMLAYTNRIETVGVACTTPATYPADLLSDTRTFYDGATTHTTAPTKGDITKTEVAESWGGTTPRYITTSRATHDQHGRAIEAWDATGERSTIAFTPTTGGPVTQTLATNPLGHTVTTTIEPAWGQPTLIADANSRRTETSYDSLGRVTKVWAPGRNKATQTPSAEYEYRVQSSAASVVSTRSLRPDGATYTVAHAILDGLLRVRQVQAPSPGITGGRIISESHYDSRGAAYKSNGPFFNGAPPDTALVTPINDNDVPTQTLTEFDGAGRATAAIVREMGVEKWRTTWSYGGDRVHVDPPAGATPITRVVDARGQATQLQQYIGQGPTGTYQTTRYSYTDAGELSTVSDPEGNVWRNFYDLRGFTTRREDPVNGTTTFTYDDAGRLRSTTDSRNITLAYDYDRLSRKVGLYDGSLTGLKRAEWAFDMPGGLGLPASSTRFDNGNAYVSRVEGYDDAGRPTGGSVVIPAVEGPLAGSYATTFAYRPNGMPQSVSLPSAGGLPAETLTVGYNTIGLPDTLSGSNSYVKQTTYSDLGELGQLNMSTATSGKKTSQTFYYERGTRRLSQIRLDRQATGVNQGNLYFSYDAAGNVTRIADLPVNLPSDIQCFRHDHFQRITDAWTPNTDNCATNPTAGALGGPAPYWHSYEYDGIGNRSSEVQHASSGDTTRTYTYPALGQPQRPTLRQVTTLRPGQTATTDSFAYNETGDTVTRSVAGQPGHALTWTAEGQLASDTANNQTTTFVYTADGQRLLRRDPTHTTLYLGQTELRCERSTGAITGTRQYVHGGRVIGIRTPGGLSWLSADHHGTSLFAVNPTTLDVQRKRYLPFGGQRGAPPMSWPGDRGFLGGPLDWATGLTHLGARDYDSVTGRFISVDPIMNAADSQQMNGYTYANNNPTTFHDPTGLFLDCGCASDRYGSDNIVHNANGSPLSNLHAQKYLNPQQKGRWQAKAAVRDVKAKADRALLDQQIGQLYKDCVNIKSSCPAAVQLSEANKRFFSTPIPATTWADVVAAWSATAKAIVDWTTPVYDIAECQENPGLSSCAAAGAAFLGSIGKLLGKGAKKLLGNSDEAAKVPPNGGLGDLVRVTVKDPDAIALAGRLDGQPTVRFANDPIGREFDAVSDKYVAQTKPASFTLNQKFRNQAKATFEYAMKSGRLPYFHFNGAPGPGVLEAVDRYSERYGVTAVIDLRPLGG